MIKLNLRPLPHGELALTDVVAISYETVQGCEEDVSASSEMHDFNIALYKQNKLMNWVQLCPCGEKNVLEFRNRFIDESDECSEINEKLLQYAEKWASQQGYEKIKIQACDVSVSYYLRMHYLIYGEPVCEKGNLLYTMIKQL